MHSQELRSGSSSRNLNTERQSRQFVRFSFPSRKFAFDFSVDSERRILLLDRIQIYSNYQLDSRIEAIFHTEAIERVANSMLLKLLSY